MSTASAIILNLIFNHKKVQQKNTEEAQIKTQVLTER